MVQGGLDRLKTYTNEAWASPDAVTKIYRPSILSLADPRIRLRREVTALRYYPKHYPDFIFTPRLIDVDETTMTIKQERIRGESLQEKALRGEEIERMAGELLRMIHVPLARPTQYLREDFERTTEATFKAPHIDELLEIGGIGQVDLAVNWDKVYQLGSARLHGDYWLEHVIVSDKDGRPYVVDWDHARPGSPYRDFVTVQTWIIDAFGKGEAFWEGYGSKPDEQSLKTYITLQCLKYLATLTPELYLQEPEDGFYHRQMNMLKKLNHHEIQSPE